MKEAAKLLVIEDEKAIRNLLSVTLVTNGYRVLDAASGKEGLSIAASHCPQLVLLDLGLPDIDGLEVLRDLRTWSMVPVVVLSAREHESVKVEALDLGADDYVTKPFSNVELLARIRTALRRPSFAHTGRETLQIKGLEVRGDRHIVLVDGREIHLTPIEHRIVYLLACNAGCVLTYERMLKTLWGPHSDDPQILRVNMANIRRKIEKNPADPRYIVTEIGIGYRMLDT